MEKILYIWIFILLVSCGRGYEVSELYEQPINDSDFSIVEYLAMSSLNDGTKYGYTLKKSTSVIDIVDAQKMPFRYLTGVPSKDTIRRVEFLKGGSRLPEFETSKISYFDGLTIVTDYYKYAVGSSANLSYKFKSFEERNDSIIIKGLVKMRFNLPVSNGEIGFKKGNVKLEESKERPGTLERIKIPAILAPEYIGGSIDNITLKRNDSLKINGQVFFKFVPLEKIEISAFSNSGIYKKKRILDKHKI